MLRNVIKHRCLFCKKEDVILAWDKRTHKCSNCGVEYHYIPNQSRPPGQGFGERQKAKNEPKNN